MIQQKISVKKVTKIFSQYKLISKLFGIKLYRITFLAIMNKLKRRPILDA